DIDTPLGIDDVTFDIPAGPSDPFFTLVPAVGAVELAPGTSVGDAIRIGRINGSVGAVQLNVNGLPQGVTTTFTPNPATDTATLTLAASPDAPLTATLATITITG